MMDQPTDRVHLDDSSARRFHEIYSDDIHGQKTPLKDLATRSPAARLAIAMGLTDAIVHHDRNGEGYVVEKAFDDYLGDVSSKAIMRAVATAGEDMERLCDPFAATALLARGINPIALLAFERAMSAEDAPTEHAVYSNGLINYLCVLPDGGPRRGIEYDYAVIQLADATWWDGHELQIPRGSIASTLQVAAVGMPVGCVLQHPLVDPQLIIDRIDETSSIELELRRKVTPCTWREAMRRAMA